MDFLLQALPPGMQFRPEEDEIVGFFLPNKVTGQQSHYETVYMPDCDLYGDFEPWELFEAYRRRDQNSNTDLYFFTELKKKHAEQGKRIDRCTDKGTWHQENRTDDIEMEGVTATKRRFNYRNKNRPDQDRGWIMFEYSCSSLSDSLVACVLRKNVKKTKSY